MKLRNVASIALLLAVALYVGDLALMSHPPSSTSGIAYAQTAPSIIASAVPQLFANGVRNGCSGTINIGAGGLGNADQTTSGQPLNCLANFKFVACQPVYPAGTATPAGGNMPNCFQGSTATQFATLSAPTATASAVFAVMPTLAGPTPTIVWEGKN